MFSGVCSVTPLDLFKSLSDLTRLQSVLLIQQEQELCVCELIVALELSQPKISRHLALLRDSQLLTTEKRGQWVFYSLATDLPDWVRFTLRQAAEQQDLSELSQRLQTMGDRPDRSQLCC
jgi:ArsR family transcriptional regulator